MTSFLNASNVLLPISVALIFCDGLITERGLRMGLLERNPVLASVVGRFGLKGLWGTRFLAVICLLLLFLILDAWLWVAFSSIFIAVMLCTVWRGANKLRNDRSASSNKS